MRLLHTSDWHVGRTFHGRDLIADQRAVLAAIADLVSSRAVDVVVVPGDLYDRAVPSTDAVRVLTDALQAIRDAGAQIVASSGNHDSAPRLGAFAEFLAAGGLHLRTDIDRIAEPVVLSDADGPVAIYPVPYLEPEVVRRRLDIAGRASHQAVMEAALRPIRDDIAQRPGTRSVLLAHAFVVGAMPGGSERSIAVGGVESVTAEVFEGIDYVALGHLHGAQAVSERVRYCGSPLAYSFTEAGHDKCALLVELAADGQLQVERLPLPVPRQLAEVSGTLDDILAGHDDLVDCYLSARLTDPVRPLEAMRRLQARFPYAVTISWEPPGGRPAGEVAAITGGALSDGDLVDRFLAECRGSGPTPGEISVIQQALAVARAVREES